MMGENTTVYWYIEKIFKDFLNETLTQKTNFSR